MEKPGKPKKMLDTPEEKEVKEAVKEFSDVEKAAHSNNQELSQLRRIVEKVTMRIQRKQAALDASKDSMESSIVRNEIGQLRILLAEANAAIQDKSVIADDLYDQGDEIATRVEKIEDEARKKIS